MKRILSTALAVALLLSLGVLAVLARGGGDILTPVINAVAAAAPSQTAAAPDAPMAAENYNMIAIPLDASGPVTPFTASGLGVFLGPAVKQVSKLDPNAQGYLTWYPEIGDGDDFDLEVGGVYMVLLGTGANNIVSFVGGVPDAGTIRFDLVRPTGGEFFSRRRKPGF